MYNTGQYDLQMLQQLQAISGTVSRIETFLTGFKEDLVQAVQDIVPALLPYLAAVSAFVVVFVVYSLIFRRGD